MKSKGIRISDEINNIVSVNLKDILEEIPDGNNYIWSILFLDAMGNLGEGKSIPFFENEILNSKNGYILNWKELISLTKNFEQIIDIILIGSDKNLLKRYETDQDKYQMCDFAIEKNDSSFWEVFSKNEKFIEALANKFKQVKFLETNFQTKS